MMGLPSSDLNLYFGGSLIVSCTNSLCSWLFGVPEIEDNIKYSKYMGFLIAKLIISVFPYCLKIHNVFILTAC